MEQLYQSRYTGPEIDRRLGLMAGNFLWIKWSAAFPVVEMLDEPGPYIGIYTGEDDTPPDDPDEYRWYLNSGADGEPGPEGPEGPAGPANELSIGSVQSGTTANATITGTAPEQTLNLVLPKGDTGTGLDILGTYATLSALQAAVPSPTQGDMYNVGEAAPYHVYMWDTTEPPSAWKDQGILHGPPGQDGAQGAQGIPGPNEITTATATPLSGVLVGKDGYVKEGVAGVDFVPPISGAAAGLAVFTATNGMQEAKSAADTRNALGATSGIWPESLGGTGMAAPTMAAATNLVGASVIDTNATQVVKIGRFGVLRLIIHTAGETTPPASSTPLLQLPEGYRPEDRVYIVAMSDGITPSEFGLTTGGAVVTTTTLTAGKWYVGTAAFMIA